jgi:hypothetical protein
MDEPAQTHGPSHRRFRHAPDHPPKWAVDKYGFETAQNIMLDHIFRDRQSSRQYSISQPLRSAPKTPYEIAEGNVAMAVFGIMILIIVIGGGVLTQMDLGPTSAFAGVMGPIFLVVIAPMLVAGLLGEAHLRKLKQDGSIKKVDNSARATTA